MTGGARPPETRRGRSPMPSSQNAISNPSVTGLRVSIPFERDFFKFADPLQFSCSDGSVPRRFGELSFHPLPMESRWLPAFRVRTTPQRLMSLFKQIDGCTRYF